jgi:hypothetical protein
MPGFAPLDLLPLWALSLVLFVANLLLNECGFRTGRLLGRHAQKESDTTVGAVVGAELGLLAFLLAISFGIGASRFDVRRQMVLDEANAIGTTFEDQRLCETGTATCFNARTGPRLRRECN